MVFYNNDIHIDKYKLSEEVLFSKIDAEIVIVSPFSGSYFTLDSIGSRIWELLSKQPATVDELTTQLMEEYDVDKETCIKDIQEFIDDMASKKLIIPLEQENPPEK